MKLQFEKRNFRCLRSVIRDVKSQEQTQEIRIPDGMPDVGKVLGCWGQVLIRGKEWRSSGISVNGGIMVWVLYMPEDEGNVMCMESWIPYQIKCDFNDSERDGGIFVQPLIRGIEARAISVRKLMIRADVDVLFDAMVDSCIEYNFQDEIPEGIQILKDNYSALIPKEMNEKAFLIEENISAISSAQNIEKIVYYHLQPDPIENKVMGDKLIFRGIAKLHGLAMDKDGQFVTIDTEIPFSQFSELGAEYSDLATASVCVALTNMELDKCDDDSYRLRAGLTGQYIVYDVENVSVVKDAYKLHSAVKITSVPFVLPSVLDVQKVTEKATCKLNEDCVQVVDYVFYPHHPETFKEGEKTIVEYSGIFQALCQYSDGGFGNVTERWQSSGNYSSDETVKLQLSLCASANPTVLISGVHTQLSTDLPTEFVWIAGEPMSMVSELEISESELSESDQYSLVLRRTGNESLWEIAKSVGSTVEEIMVVNNLQVEPDADRMLLIPIL